MEKYQLRTSDLYNSALGWLQQKQPEVALRLLRHIDLNGPLDVELDLILGAVGSCQVNIRDEDLGQAIERFYDAIRLNPKRLFHRINLCEALLWNNDAVMSEKVARQVIDQGLTGEETDYQAQALIKLALAANCQKDYFRGYQARLKVAELSPSPHNTIGVGLDELLLSDMDNDGLYRLGLKSYLNGRNEQMPLKLLNHWNIKDGLPTGVVNVYLEQGLGDAVMMIPYLSVLKGSATTVNIISALWHDKALDLIQELVFWGVKYKFYKMADNFLPEKDSVSLWMFDLLQLAMPKEIYREGYPVKVVDSLELNSRVGICWRGSAGHPFDRLRSMKLRDIKDFVKKHGKRLVSLQADLTKEEESLLNESGVTIVDTTANRDLIRTVKSLGSVVTVDTMISHLAGILEVKCYTLLAPCVDWRWGMSRRSTDWYKNHELLRQDKLGEWKPLLEQVGELL